MAVRTLLAGAVTYAAYQFTKPEPICYVRRSDVGQPSSVEVKLCNTGCSMLFITKMSLQRNGEVCNTWQDALGDITEQPFEIDFATAGPMPVRAFGKSVTLLALRSKGADAWEQDALKLMFSRGIDVAVEYKLRPTGVLSRYNFVNVFPLADEM